MTTLALTDPVNGTVADANLIASNNAAIKTVINGGIDSSNITDGAITNADISASAAIAGSKLGTGLNGPPGTEVDYQEFLTDVSITATTEATAQLVVASSSIAYAGQLIVVEFWCPGIATSGSNPILTLIDNAGGAVLGGVTPAAPGTIPYIKRRFIAPSATKSYRVVAWVVTPTASIQSGAGGAGFRLPGWIKITKG